MGLFLTKFILDNVPEIITDEDIKQRNDYISDVSELKRVLSPKHKYLYLCKIDDQSTCYPVFKLSLIKGWLNTYDAVDPPNKGAFIFRHFNSDLHVQFIKGYSRLDIYFSYINSETLNTMGCRYLATIVNDDDNISHYLCLPNYNDIPTLFQLTHEIQQVMT